MNNVVIIILTRLILLVSLFVLLSLLALLNVFIWPIFPLSILTCAVVLVSTAVFLFLPKHYYKRDSIILSQLLLDGLFLTAFFSLTGGLMNPFTSLYLIPIVYAAMMLKVHLSLIVLSATFLGYIFITYQSYPLTIHDQSNLSIMNLHVYGMIISFFLASILTLIFIYYLSANNRKKEQIVEEIKTTLAVKNHFAMMGVIAANTTHELNTPLSTIAMIFEELQENTSPEERLKLTHTGKTQIKYCKDVLEKTLKTFGIFKAKSLNPIYFSEYLSNCLNNWIKKHPTIQLKKDLSLHSETYQNPYYIEEVILSLLDNSASIANTIEISIIEKNKKLAISVCDNGEGFSEESLLQLRSPLTEQLNTYIDNANTNRGLGLILKQFIVKRLNGSFKIESKGNKSTVSIILPLQEFQHV